MICPKCKSELNCGCGACKMNFPKQKNKMIITGPCSEKCPVCGLEKSMDQWLTVSWDQYKTVQWVESEVKFLTWLYNHKNFLGKLKVKDFKSFSSKKEAVESYQREMGETYYG